MKDEIIIYQADEGTTRLEVKIDEGSVWLNRQQISTLFERDIKTIGKHIANVLTEELKGIPVVAKFATTATDGKTYQLVTNCDRLSSIKHSSVYPMVFTEQGVAMLTSVLRSNRAIEMNIEIMRAFARYRAFLVENVDINKRIEELDDKINRVFEYLLDKIRGFDSNKSSDARNEIGYKQ